MVTYDETQPHRVPLGARVAAARRTLRKRYHVARIEVAKRLPTRFDVVQLAGAGAASTGIFFEWGTAVGLMVTGAAVLLTGWHFERQSG